MNNSPVSARRAGYALGTATLVGAGTYLLVYLYRWEWNRALIAGVFLLVAEVALAAAAILERLRSMESRLAATVDKATAAAAASSVSPPSGSARALAVLRGTAPPARDHFAWLSPRNQQLGVFVPVLMGAGAVLSGLAWLVERVARRTARPVLERRLAGRLGALTLPAGGLVGPVPGDQPAGPSAAASRLLGPGAGGRP